MKFFAMLCNFSALGIVVYAILTEGFPDHFEEQAIAVAITLFPIINLIALSGTTPFSNSLLGTFFVRKKLEEEAKIEELKTKLKKSNVDL